MTARPPPRVWLGRLGAMSLLLAVAGALWWQIARDGGLAVPVTELALVVPDGLAYDEVHLLAWRDAAAEAGFALKLVSASALLREAEASRSMALIIPDTVHREMNDALVAEIGDRVRDGAKLMLVHDAGIATIGGQYHPLQSRLSALAGVRYGLYGELRADMLHQQVALVDAGAVSPLGLPPGKLVRGRSNNPLTSAGPAPAANEPLAVVSYHYGQLRYPVFATEGRFNGERLMHAEDGGLLAGLHAVGKGQVLFVNLPLTYLKLRTDGFFLQAFLRYFAQDLVQLPQLAPMPAARGALIMNWHIDSGRAVPAMQRLAELGAFEQGPYSVHLTVGPDVDHAGDGAGMDLANNPLMKSWVRRFVERGDEVGSHGGWIHNAFGRLVGSQAVDESTAMLARNSAVLSQVSGRPVREYSAPTGNHPAWVTQWLRTQGVNGYYFTGDIGMAPTRSYQDGQRGPADMWAFPVLSYGSYASFEESHANQVPEASLLAWLDDVADFCASHRTVRLVYFHPPGIALFPKAFAQWMRHTAEQLRSGRLRWMTMTQFTDFANRRLLVNWDVKSDPQRPGHLRLEADHANSLDQISWLLPALRFGLPQVLIGQAEVLRDGPYWRITAGPASRLVVGFESLHTPAAAGPNPSTRVL